jgi:uncharacterized protein (DUF1684 family)
VTDAISVGNAFDLLDWKRRIFDLYREVREAPDPERAWERWRAVRDGLFSAHPQSPVPAADRGSFKGLPFFPYDPAARVLGVVHSAPPESYDIATSGGPGGSYRFTRIATVKGTIGEDGFALEAYWLEGYGGGLFLPFRDATAGRETYGAGRYLFDTVKGADLGTTPDGRLILDFNFAYNPSCAYDPAWVCPLAPPPNRLRIPIRAGERYRSEER